MEEHSQQLLQLGNIQAQLASDDPVLHATSKFTVTHLTFNAFKETWPLTSAYHHVQIGVRHGRFVYAFPTRNGGAIYTVASGKYPDLKSVDISCETLEDVDLVAPFDAVEEWKSELSGSLSREFRALLKYCFLLHVAKGGRYKNLGLPVDVEDLKVALMMVHQARQPKTSPPSLGSTDASDAEPSPELTDTPLLSGPIMTARDEPATEAHPADQPAVPDAHSAASDSMQLDNQDLDQDSSSDAIHEGLPATAPTSASTLVPGDAPEDTDDELEGVDDATISFVPEKASNDPTSKGNDQTEVYVHDSAPRGPVKGFSTVNRPDRRRPTRKQVVPVANDADDAPGTEDGHFIASSRKDFRNKSRPPDDRRTEDAAKAVRFAEEQTEPQPDMSASDDGTVGFDDETDIEIIDGSELDENTHQSPPDASSESPDAEAESQHDAHMNVVQDPSLIERIAFQATARPPPQQQKAYNTLRRGAADKHCTSLSGDFRSMTVAPVFRNSVQPATQSKQDQDTPAGAIPLEALSTEQFRIIAYGENTTAAFDGRMLLAKRILAQRAVQAGRVMLRGGNVRDYEEKILERYAKGRGPVDDSWMNDRLIAWAELNRRAALRDAEDEPELRVITRDKRVTSRPPPVQPPMQPRTQVSRQRPVQDRVQPPAQAPLQLPVQAPSSLPYHREWLFRLTLSCSLLSAECLVIKACAYSPRPTSRFADAT